MAITFSHQFIHKLRSPQKELFEVNFADTLPSPTITSIRLSLILMSFRSKPSRFQDYKYFFLYMLRGVGYFSIISFSPSWEQVSVSFLILHFLYMEGYPQ